MSRSLPIPMSPTRRSFPPPRHGAGVLLLVLALVPLAAAQTTIAPREVKEEVPIGLFHNPDCPDEPGRCAARYPYLKIGPVTIRLQGDVTVAEDGVEGLLGEPGRPGVLWVNVSSEAEDAGSVNVSVTLDGSANVTWEKTLYEAYFPKRAESSASSTRSDVTFEERMGFTVPKDAQPGSVPVPFTVRVGNETLHAAFFLNVVAPSAAPPPDDREGPPTPGAGVALVAAAAAVAALALGARRRRGRGD